MTTYNLHQLGIDALDIMDLRGWCIGAMFHPESGNVCATGALWLATGRDEEEAMAPSDNPGEQTIYDWDSQVLSRVLYDADVIDANNVWQWNDWRGEKTVREALANLPDVDVEL